MIVDPSALVAMALPERERTTFVDPIAGAERRSMSAGSWIEIAAVGTRRLGAAALASVERFISDVGIALAPVAAGQAEIGHDAYRKYGIGTGHPARLDFGDRFACALAKASGEPLPFKGGDFIHTDVRRAA